jgi:hypothetical protein
MENVDIHQPDNADINQSQSTRFSVHQALKNASFIGSPYVGGKADGEMTVP